MEAFENFEQRGTKFSEVFGRFELEIFKVLENWKFFTGRCSIPNLLRTCSSFNRENGHPLLTCSSPCTTQLIFLLGLNSFRKLFKSCPNGTPPRCWGYPWAAYHTLAFETTQLGRHAPERGNLQTWVTMREAAKKATNCYGRPHSTTKQHSSVVMNFQKTQENETQLSTSFSSSSKIAIKALRAGTCDHTALIHAPGMGSRAKQSLGINLTATHVKNCCRCWTYKFIRMS